MFKKITAVLLCIFLIQTGSAQNDKPDFKKIEAAIKDKNSPLFYSALMKRYNDNDTTLTLEEWRYLYYGFSCQDNYSPYGKPSVQDDLSKAIKAEETSKVIELEKMALAEYPFNLRDLYRLSTTLEDKGEAATARLYHVKLLGVARAIMSTGDGTTDSTAMYVVSVDHEYDLISLLGFTFGNSQALIHAHGAEMDKMKLADNKDNIKYLYFNVERLFAAMGKMFEKKN